MIGMSRLARLKFIVNLTQHLVLCQIYFLYLYKGKIKVTDDLSYLELHSFD